MSFVLKMKRGETPFFRVLGRTARWVLAPRAVRIPRFLKAPLRFLYEIHFGVIVTWNTVVNLIYRHPLFQARCAEFGENVVVDRLPFVTGHVAIHVGNNVRIGGRVVFQSGHVFDKPVLILKDYAEIGWNTMISVNREVIIEEHARVSYDCRISDSDGHPRQSDLRAADAPVDIKDVRPVRICRNAWIGNGSHIMKGVTIGEGAVVGANSVVISDVPPFSLALGNPAEVFLRNFGRPSKKPAS